MPRCFYCAPLPSGAAAALAAFAGERLPAWLGGWRLSPIAADDLHLTLRFFAAVEGERMAALESGLAGLAATVPSVRLRPRRLACWPSIRAARVVVALVAGGEALAPLAAAAERFARTLGFAPESRPFRPHLTLARVRAPGPAPAVAPPELPDIAISWAAIALWESLPPGTGRRYRERLRLPLSGSAAQRLSGSGSGVA